MRAQRELTLVEVVVAVTISLVLLAATYAAFSLSAQATGQALRTSRYVADGVRLKARTLDLLRDAPAVPNDSTPAMPALPAGWPAGSSMSPQRVPGAGTAPDELFFFTSVVVDNDADGVISANERGLGAAGVVGDYYRVHVAAGPDGDELVRDLVDGSTGDVRRREVLALNIDQPLDAGLSDDRRSFLVLHSGVAGDPLYFLRARQAFVTVSQSASGRSTIRKTHAFNVTARGS